MRLKKRLWPTLAPAPQGLGATEGQGGCGHASLEWVLPVSLTGQEGGAGLDRGVSYAGMSLERRTAPWASWLEAALTSGQ